MVIYRISFLLFVVVMFLFSSAASAQQEEVDKKNTRQAVIYHGDTIPYVKLPTFRYYAPRVFSNRFEEARYRRLVRNVKRAYPYARLAGIKFEQYSEKLEQAESEAQRRRLARDIEREIKNEFEGELRRLTISQGHILIKLIDRETRHTSYDVLRDFRGNFTAIFWQSFGRLFGYNLKDEYDPENEDRLIEEIVQLIERGDI